LHGTLVRICKGKSASSPAYRIFGCSPGVGRLALVVHGIKVGLPEGNNVRAKHLNEVLEVRQLSTFLPQLTLGLPTAHVVAVGLLSTWPDRPPELRATLWASAEIFETFGFFYMFRAAGNLRLRPCSLQRHLHALMCA
jgi:hypothetical protein